MKSFKFEILALLLLLTTNVAAHVRWDPNGNVTERAPNYTSCATARGDSPALFRSGSGIEVSFEVVITHGEPYKIEFSPASGQGYGDYLLRDNIPEMAGITTLSITLPNIECETCSLRVFGAGYTSCADIRLTATGLPDVDPLDLIAPSNVGSLNSMESDEQVVLNWTNPADDFYEVLILQSESTINATPVDGTAYVEGDIFDDAMVIFKGSSTTTTAANLMMDTGYYFKIYAYDESINYAPGVQQQVMTTNVGNSAPSVELNVLQSVQLSLDVYRDRGQVVVQAIISDPDTDDTHSVDWSETDIRLVDSDASDTTFSFDPASLEVGNYVVSLSVTDSGTPTFMDSAEVTINVLETTATPMPTPAPTSAPTPVANTGGSSGGGGSFGGFMLFILPLLFFTRSGLSLKGRLK